MAKGSFASRAQAREHCGCSWVGRSRREPGGLAGADGQAAHRCTPRAPQSAAAKGAKASGGAWQGGGGAWQGGASAARGRSAWDDLAEGDDSSYDDYDSD